MDMLRVEKDRIVDGQGQTIQLRGFAVGGWMNMEHFMNGFPGAEHQLRAVMAQELGARKSEFFFQRLLDYFFTEEDVVFIRSLGANLIRLAINYRHFESDENPFAYLEAGFSRLNQALGWCREHGLYVILDLHAVQGWQNSDWHSDNATRHSLFWRDRLFQDRFVALWQEFGRRYKDDPVIAGYDLMNEPLAGAPFGRFRENPTIQLDQHQYRPDWTRMNAIYRRAVEAIRQVDPNHIIILEGDYFSNLFEGLEPPFADNLVYSNHTYNPGPGENWGVEEQRVWHEDHEGTRFARRYQVPLFVGEFGAGITGDLPRRQAAARVIDAQIQLYNQTGDHWTIWNYKDIGAMGLVTLKSETTYLQTIKPVLQAKQALEVDSFIHSDISKIPVKAKLAEIARLIEAAIQDRALEPEVDQCYLEQQLLSGYASQLMQKKYVQCFAGMGEAEIDRILQSHLLKNCTINETSLQFLKQRFND
jgi:endoglucanase